MWTFCLFRALSFFSLCCRFCFCNRWCVCCSLCVIDFVFAGVRFLPLFVCLCPGFCNHAFCFVCVNFRHAMFRVALPQTRRHCFLFLAVIVFTLFCLLHFSTCVFSVSVWNMFRGFVYSPFSCVHLCVLCRWVLKATVWCCARTPSAVISLLSTRAR